MRWRTGEDRRASSQARCQRRRHLTRIRTATRKIDMDEDLTMLIGPAHDGTPLEIGLLDISGEDPVIIHAMRIRPRFYPFTSQRR